MLASAAVALFAKTPPDPWRGSEAAIRERLAGLYLDGLAASPEELPLLRLQRARQREALDDLAYARGIDTVLSALAERGIAPVPWKGRALALAYWPRPELRPAGDLDLLIEPDALEPAVSALERHGYRRAPDESRGLLRRTPTGVELVPPKGGRVVVDLHTRPFRSVGHRITAADLLARARPSTLQGLPVRALDAADLLHLVFVHAAKHAVRSPKWLLDLLAIACASDEATWATALERAAAHGTTRPMWAAARLTAQLSALLADDPLRAHLRPELLDAIAPAAPMSHLIDRIFSLDKAATSAPLSSWERYALEIVLEPGLVARARMAAGVAERLLRL
jgi:hypothetical protein